MLRRRLSSCRSDFAPLFLSLLRGTEGSNPAPSSGESRANLIPRGPVSNASWENTIAGPPTQLTDVTDDLARIPWLGDGGPKSPHCDRWRLSEPAAAQPSLHYRASLAGRASAFISAQTEGGAWKR